MITELEIAAAVKTLAGSEKGRQALQVQLAWLEEGGLSLDGMNQRALLTLLVGSWTGKAGTVRDAMHAAIGEQILANGSGICMIVNPIIESRCELLP